VRPTGKHCNVLLHPLCNLPVRHCNVPSTIAMSCPPLQCFSLVSATLPSSTATQLPLPLQRLISHCNSSTATTTTRPRQQRQRPLHAGHHPSALTTTTATLPQLLRINANTPAEQVSFILFLFTLAASMATSTIATTSLHPVPQPGQ